MSPQAEPGNNPSLCLLLTTLPPSYPANLRPPNLNEILHSASAEPEPRPHRRPRCKRPTDHGDFVDKVGHVDIDIDIDTHPHTQSLRRGRGGCVRCVVECNDR